MKNNFKPNEYTKDLKSAIEELGGQKAVSERFKIPYRTVQNWARGTRHPPEYVARLLIDHAQEKVIHESCMNDSYSLYIEDQETLSWYEKELKKKREKIEELEARNEVLFGQMEAMTELAQKRREHIEANEAAIDQLEKALDATREDLAKERHAREVWARQAGILAGR